MFDQLHLMSVYVAVAEEQSFSAAARRLSISAPAVTRAIAALEKKLAIKLLNRTTRFVRMTQVGERYYDDAKRIVDEVKIANDTAAGINATPLGNISITAPVLFGKMFVMPSIIEYLNTYTETKVNAVFLDRVVNLIDEGLDVGIRIGELPDSSMRALKVGKIRLVLCASPEYLKLHGIPQTPEDLKKHTIISSQGLSANNDWKFEDKQKSSLSVKVNPRLVVTSNDAAIEAAKNSLGIARLLSYQIAPNLTSGELKTVLEPYQPAAKPIHIVHRENQYTSAKVRAFIDLIANNLRKNSALN